MDTDMQGAIRESPSVHAPIRDQFIKAFRTNQLVPPEKSAQKCLSIILKDTFVSGSHIDYYDNEPT